MERGKIQTWDSLCWTPMDERRNEKYKRLIMQLLYYNRKNLIGRVNPQIV